MLLVSNKMSNFEIDNFIKYYQKNHFRENGDEFQNADSKRKCAAQIFKASSNLNSNDSSCLLLDLNLASYSAIVDKRQKQTNVNNYAITIDALKTNLKRSNPQVWRSSLSSSALKPSTLLQPLNHENNENCYLNVTEDDIKQLNMAIHHVPKNNAIKSQDTNTISLRKQVQDYPKTDNILSSNNLKDSNIFSYNKNISKFTTQQNINNNVQVKPKFTFQRNPEQQPKIEHSNNVFRTAKEELIVQKQNQKDGKQQQQRNMYSSNNSIQPHLPFGSGAKKVLGSRRGVQSKFISPDLKEEPMKYENQEQSDEVVDERLRNIDPKMVELIRSEIMDRGDAIGWDDIAGLEFAKTTIQEIVVWPLLRPDIFTGLRSPPKGILLFGPPGTGKTLIGKCIASQSQSTFFSISASSLTSKWIGDGEKMVRALFAVAQCHQPAVIFIDEIDSLLTQRSDTEHESSRRIKTEFLVQLDGAATGDSDRILVIGATNRPQELDEAARRRLVRRLYIPLPEKKARKQIVMHLMSSENHILTEGDIDEISELTDGYSGADMKNLCAEASLGPIRSIDISLIHNIQPEQVRPINVADFKQALNRIRPSVSSTDLDQYVVWDNTYGSGIH